MPQTSVASTMAIGVAGQLADLHSVDTALIESVLSEETSVEIPFGIAVRKGTADNGVRVMSATTHRPYGIVVHNHYYSKPDELGDVGLKPTVAFGILRKGRILVKVEDAVAPGSDVRVRCVAAGAEVAGAFRAAADTTDCIDLTAFAQWRSSAGAGELAILEIDLTNVDLTVADT